jgi:hypothetical protein
MKSVKESSKDSRSKKAVVLKQATSTKQKQTKLVEVKLKSDSCRATANKSTAKKAITAAVKAIADGKSAAATATRLTEIITAPDESLLKPFRRAAEELRRKQKAERKNRRASMFKRKPLKGWKKYLLDLRIHPEGTVGYFARGGIDPGPAFKRLVQVKGLSMIGLTDYYKADYIDVVKKHLDTVTSPTMLPGLIMRCSVGACSDLNLLTLFPPTFEGVDLISVLDKLRVPRRAYGDRSFYLEQDLDEIIEVVEAAGGIVIPTRVDTTPHRQLAIPELVEKYGFHSFDLAHPDSPELYFRDRWADGEFTFFYFSSADALGQIGNRVEKVCMPEASFNGLKDLVKRRIRN